MWAHCAPLLAIRSMDAVVATICLFPPRGHRSVKATIAVLALVLVLQTDFVFSQLQDPNARTPGPQPQPDYTAIATELKCLSTDVTALKTRVSAPTWTAAFALSRHRDGRSDTAVEPASEFAVPLLLWSERTPIYPIKGWRARRTVPIALGNQRQPDTDEMRRKPREARP